MGLKPEVSLPAYGAECEAPAPTPRPARSVYDRRPVYEAPGLDDERGVQQREGGRPGSSTTSKHYKHLSHQLIGSKDEGSELLSDESSVCLR